METQKSKKNWIVRIAVVAFALTLITCCLLGSTLAKYTSSANGTTTDVTVAQWNWQINSADAADTFSFTASAIVDTVDGKEDANIAANKIAPGSKGSFTVAIANASDVDGTYAIDYTALEGSPIAFYSDADHTTALADVEATTLAMGASKTITVYWVWAFDGDDAADLAFAGANSTANLLSATMTFTQID